LSLLEDARQDADSDLNIQIDIFLEEQKRDEQDFLHQFDATDSQAICQAIQLQVGPTTQIVKQMNHTRVTLVSA
jgi:hypothetical protein